jgi:high affinity Mn2+ porin
MNNYMIRKKIYQTKFLFAFVAFNLVANYVLGQQADTLTKERFSIHAQTTVITQYKPAFNVKYTGQNSLVPNEETKRSITSTLFLGAKLWHGASIYINPEIGGGSGLSGSLGVGASTNGETYRIDNSAPQFELARLFFRQVISLNQNKKYSESGINTLGGTIPINYFSFTIGKICISDMFDINSYSHDPRTQFMSWALMSNGAWDFPANTRGYTPSVVLEYVTPKHELRYGFSLVSTTPNGMIMNWNIGTAGSHTLEYTYKYAVSGKNGALRFLSFFTTANMGNYNQSIALNPESPDIHATEKNGRSKYGFGVNWEQQISNDIGAFVRASCNDGNNETWEFTEIDRSVSFGMSLNGNKWKRQNDIIGLAYVVSGLSAPHRNYLKAGGMGFELGDGNLNYSVEQLTEIYYSMEFTKFLFVSGTCQFILNPAYNGDRGHVTVLSLRVHIII